MVTSGGITDYLAKLYAYQLTRRVQGDQPDRLATSIMDSSVDLNPHQIDAALFAFQSPLSKGVILADEVGLGKTIEAGLVISQFWAERARRILVITPASLRKQWEAELRDKFHLPTVMIEGTSFNDAVRRNPRANPFDHHGERIVICSLPYAASKHEYLAGVPWDLVVIDEAHHLRSSNGKRYTSIKQSVSARKILLLTATPLQNRLDELWSLASLIDEHQFGEQAAFRKRYPSPLSATDFASLRDRLSPLVQRTLRRQAREFIQFTNRIPLLEEFTPTQAELEFSVEVSEFLLESSFALPQRTQHLMIMMLQKLHASSTFAIASALRTIATRLKRELAELPVEEFEAELAADIDDLANVMDEWEIEVDSQSHPSFTPQDRITIQREIEKVEAMAARAERITHNAKMDALKKGLRRAFREMDRLGAPRKALIFTESRHTQQYILRELEKDPDFPTGLITFDGSNNGPVSTEIYNQWRAAHAHTDRVTGTRSADIRTALVEYFRDEARIMIATEAAAEGVNMQFCSLVINYDLPWNPQRIEQRIGRCHRYGQQFDVVVLNFLNRENIADQRVYELLDEKFHLFDGVFGASDEVLGSLDSVVEFEKRVAEIYRTARSKAEIDASFNQMQLDFFDVIENQRLVTEQKLLEHFDENVAERFRTRRQDLDTSLDRTERAFMALTRHELGERLRMIDDRTFDLLSPVAGSAAGRYQLASRKSADAAEGYLYRLGHPLAEALVRDARDRPLPPVDVRIAYSSYSGKLSSLETLPVKSGWLAAVHLEISMDAGGEDHILLCAIDDAGNTLDQDIIADLLRVGAHSEREIIVPIAWVKALAAGVDDERVKVIEAMDVRIDQWLRQEEAKLEAWTEDRIVTLEHELIKVEKEIDQLQRDLRLRGGSMADQVAKRKEILNLKERSYDLEERNRQRRREIREASSELLDRAYERIHKQSEQTHLFTIHWTLS